MDMKYALFLGCQIPARVKQYDSSVRAVLTELGVTLVDIRQFNCCGYPMRNYDLKSFLLSSIRNLALAEEQGLDILVLCKCCYGSLKKAEYYMEEEGDLKDELLNILKKEGLVYRGKTRINHLLSVLHHEVTAETLEKAIIKPFQDLKIAVHYGCHALRPSAVTQFDDPVSPTIFDKLVEMTGAESVKWHKKLECCGAPAMGINDELSLNLIRKKLEDCGKAGADYLTTACPYCQMQFDKVQNTIASSNGNGKTIGSILYPQLLGLSMGLRKEILGLDANEIDISTIISYLSEE